MDSIKMNGGSFKLTAVLSYKTEGAFVGYYNKALPGWHTEEMRIATLREVYRIAQELNRQQNGDSTGSIGQDKKSGRSPGGKNDTRRNKKRNIGPEPGPDDPRPEG